MKKNSKKIYALLLVLVVLAISACAPKATPTPIGVYIETSVAATMQVQATADSLRALEQRMTQMAMPTATLAPTWTPTAAPTVAPQPTSAPIVTQPPVVLPPANTAVPTITSLCLKATLVSETIPDGTVKSKGEDFDKTWVFKNAGTCTWTTEFDFSLISGERLGGTDIDLPQTVAPGGELTITIDMSAPDSAGDYTGWWSFRDAGGNHFGVGSAGTSNVSVRIVVK
ncbi:MAG: NBR1-Ig-like domain-containing protein [Anaerolineaceae bacterium]